ncbi:hypothetical protein FA13DRAFT_1712763 [Coprinellus micaceus]|uniref:Histone-lysine N-methyltransferase, H3 lysine-79 specific n=1 Tax=Coprinellus micaceus TaxID=71717 RepID=A0A4Y7SZX8_COPMI|nr:hypothetical protein FA13DRAFT_1712763 [Coprinellus micaceus]
MAHWVNTSYPFFSRRARPAGGGGGAMVRARVVDSNENPTPGGVVVSTVEEAIGRNCEGERIPSPWVLAGDTVRGSDAAMLERLDMYKECGLRLPVVELEYPRDGCKERFLLGRPKGGGVHDPIEELKASLYTILRYYCTQAERMRLGALALEGDGEDGFSLVRLEDALEGKDGGAFVEEVGKVNEALRGMKVGGRMERGGVGWEAGRVPGGLACRIMEEHYQRCILPEAASLRSYKPWSNGTYGELLPGLVHDISCRNKAGAKVPLCGPG